MRKSFFVLALLAGSVIAAQAAGIAWGTSYDAAIAKSKKTGKLVMIDFYTDWCGWCKKLDKDTYPDPAVVKLSDKFIPIKLDAEKGGKAPAQKFKVTGYPTILFLDGNQKLVWQVVGYMPPTDFAAEMTKASTALPKRRSFEARLHANPGDADALLGLVPIYLGQGDTENGLTALSKAEKQPGSKNPVELQTAYNAVGDAYQNKQDFGKAITMFKKAEIGPDKDKVAYARLSLAVCYLSMNDKPSAVPVLKKLLAMSSVSPTYRDQAQEMLKVASK